MKTIAVIPARYASSRFPGKPLALIHGKPMIGWVYNALTKIPCLSEIYVATDDSRIFQMVQDFGGQAIMTGDCASGTDRVAEACKNLDFDVVLNIQGDEPMVRTELVRDLITAFDDKTVNIATLYKKITDAHEVNDPNIAKVIVNNNHDAIYFSRSTIPYNRDNGNVLYYKHIGMYGYTREFLCKFTSLPQSYLEKAECLEQLRVIENGYTLRMIETSYQSIGVDLPEHIPLVERALSNEV